MKLMHFAARTPQEMIKHLDDAGDVKIISFFPQNNRLVVFYTPCDEELKQSRKKKKLETKDIIDG